MSDAARAVPATLPPQSADAPIAEQLVLHANTGALEIDWSDGRHGSLSGEALRLACRCAACERRRRDGRPATDSSDGVRLVSLEPLGHLGLQLAFSDGHDRGIFPWVYLHGLFAVGATHEPATMAGSLGRFGGAR